MELLAPLMQMQRTRCNRNESCWDNGARLLTLSTSTGGRRGTQGYTCRVVVIDESHEVDWAHLAYFMPLIAMARKEGRGRMLLLGVGAEARKAPSRAREVPQYATLVLDAEMISQLDAEHRARLPDDHPELTEASWAQFFEGERDLWDEDLYRQFYECKSPGSSRRPIFDTVPALVGTPVRASAVGPDVRKAANCRWANFADSLTSCPYI